MAAVYAATHRNQKRVAVKVLHRVLAADRRLAARFLREGYLANSVGHPGVVVDDDDTDEDGAPFLVMDCWRARRSTTCGVSRAGGSRRSARCRSSLRCSTCSSSRTTRGSSVAISSPEHLFVLGTGALKVLDFGLARARELNSGADAAGRAARYARVHGARAHAVGQWGSGSIGGPICGPSARRRSAC